MSYISLSFCSGGSFVVNELEMLYSRHHHHGGSIADRVLGFWGFRVLGFPGF
jgi:hypothetical protein